MNKDEALAVVRQALVSYRGQEYGPLQRLLATCEERESVGPSGVKYYIQIEAVWDDQPYGDLRVLGLIDDGSLKHSFSPISNDFIMRPDGSFVDE